MKTKIIINNQKSINTLLSVRAFTVLEIIIIVAIIALLAFLATNYYLEHIEYSRLVVVKNNLKLVKEALARYFKDHLKYPTNLKDLHTKGYLNNSVEELLIHPLAGAGNPQILLIVPDIYNGASENAFLATLTVTVNHPDPSSRQIRDIKLKIFNSILF